MSRHEGVSAVAATSAHSQNCCCVRDGVCPAGVLAAGVGAVEVDAPETVDAEVPGALPNDADVAGAVVDVDVAAADVDAGAVVVDEATVVAAAVELAAAVVAGVAAAVDVAGDATDGVADCPAVIVGVVAGRGVTASAGALEGVTDDVEPPAAGALEGVIGDVAPPIAGAVCAAAPMLNPRLSSKEAVAAGFIKLSTDDLQSSSPAPAGAFQGAASTPCVAAAQGCSFAPRGFSTLLIPQHWASRWHPHRCRWMPTTATL